MVSIGLNMPKQKQQSNLAFVKALLAKGYYV